jgi:lantibiotic modifying enzyme
MAFGFHRAGGINWILSPLNNPLEFNGTSRIILFFTDLSQKA